jgi:hypothetical protein
VGQAPRAPKIRGWGQVAVAERTTALVAVPLEKDGRVSFSRVVLLGGDDG